MAAKIVDKETPLMKQYWSIKSKYPGALLLFRVGDFYETFGEDAKKTAEILGIVLTKRGNGSASEIELAGFPHHSLDSYLPKLVRAGQRVAICDQLEDPKMTKTIVKRGVTELVTPGVAYNDKVLETRQSNFLASVWIDENGGGCSFLDISTGEFNVSEGSLGYLKKLLSGFKPSEVLVPKGQYDFFEKEFGSDYYVFSLDDWHFEENFATEKLLTHFNTTTLKGFGIHHMLGAIRAAGASLHYLGQAQHRHLSHINSVSRIDEDQFVWLDSFTIRNLEVVTPIFPGAKPLIDILDATQTPMGARLLRKWLVLPLKNIETIKDRHSIVENLMNNGGLTVTLKNLLQSVGDLERIISKVALQKAGPREVLQLAKSLDSVAEIKKILFETKLEPLLKIAQQLNDCSAVIEKVKGSISENAPALVNKGNIFKEGVDSSLDGLRKIAFSGKDYLLEIQKREIDNTGISSLKIAYNNVFGYYLEVTNVHKDKVPAEWIRKQTLTNAERYVTPELKEYEDKILNAEGQILEIETRLFESLLFWLLDFVQPIQYTATVLAKLDCLLSFATVAEKNKYVRPVIDETYDIDLKGVRHPVIERQLPLGEEYIPNDLFLNNEDRRVIILTGPNMSGKSAVLRQTALAVLMAQVGSFVAAKSARIGLVDKIYTRVGASDNISLGESTFMVEMIETASILNNLSDRSLVLLDEIGRGTSTYDGVSLAWAIAEFLCNDKNAPKTIFATHYHELNELDGKLNGVNNFHIAIKETKDSILFLRTLQPGGSEHSFGIHVAKMAGVPSAVIQRASHILEELEKQRGNATSKSQVKVKPMPTNYPT